MRSATERRDMLKDVWRQASVCTRCPQLAATRTTVVFGSGNADADLMFVGEAPGANEDQRGVPFVGQAGGLLERLLEGIGLTRGDVFIANTLKCRPPGNRDPLPQELRNCEDYLWAQLELVRPRVVCTLGNFATKLLRGDPATGITRLHGRPEERVLGTRAVRLYPLYHPAAALYTPAMLEVLRADFARIPALLALPELPQPQAVAAAPPEAAPVPRDAGPTPAEAGCAPAEAGCVRAAASRALPELAAELPEAGPKLAEADPAPPEPEELAEIGAADAPVERREPLQLGLF